jgi:hypothetical protein
MGGQARSLQASMIFNEEKEVFRHWHEARDLCQQDEREL